MVLLKDVCPESILSSAVPKQDVDFVADRFDHQNDEAPENLCSVYDRISKSINIENFLQILVQHIQKKWITDKMTKE